MEARDNVAIAPIRWPDLRWRLYVKAKAEKDGRFWGWYVHVAQRATPRAAYEVAKQAHGAPRIDGVTFTAIDAAGVEEFLAALRDALVTRTDWPLGNRRVTVPKGAARFACWGSPRCGTWCSKGRPNAAWS
jgi:RNA-directed DNA polymerase